MVFSIVYFASFKTASYYEHVSFFLGSITGRDCRDRWYASNSGSGDHRDKRGEDNVRDEQDEEEIIDVVGSKRRGHNNSSEKEAANFDEETAAAVAR